MDKQTNSYELTILLGLGFRTMIDALHVHLATQGYDDLRPVHGFFFSRIAPDGATITEVARFLEITKQAASEMAIYLEQRGYVVRHADPQDGRGKIVTLTERGWACIREAEATMARLEAEWGALMGADRLPHLRADLRRFIMAANGGTLPQTFRPVW